MESEVAHCKASRRDIKPNLTRFSSYKMFMLKKHSLTFNYYYVSELTLLTCCLLLFPVWDSVIVLASKRDIKPNLTRFSSYKMFMLKKHSLTFNYYHVSELTLLTCCLLLFPVWDSVIVLCFVVRFLMSLLVLQSS